MCLSDWNVVRDHGDGEVEINITATFTYFRPDNSIIDIMAEFNELIEKYAI